MKHLVKILLSITAAFMAILMGAQPALAAGTWQVNDTTTTYVYSKNLWHNGPTIKAPTFAIGGVINNVSWQYSVTYPVPSGRVVQLCDATWGQCVDTQGQGVGVTSVFNGRPATDSFYFRAAVNGTGTLSPAWQVYSKSANINFA